MAGADMVLHVGDLSYANGREYVWNSFMDAIEPAASRVPYMVAVGVALCVCVCGGGGTIKVPEDWSYGMFKMSGYHDSFFVNV